MSRDLQHRLHTRLELATEMLDLPLDAGHLERLAVELTPAVKALLAEQADVHEASEPVRYAVAFDTDGQAEVHTTWYAGCLTRVAADVDLDSPAAVLAAHLRGHQPDVTATDVPTPTHVGVTVRPQSLHAWRWWLDTLAIDPRTVTVQGSAAHAVGHKDGCVVQVRGDGVPALLADDSAARLTGLIGEAAER